MQSFIQPGENTSPGKYSKALDVLPDDVGSLVSIVRGLLLHSDLLELYGLSEVDFIEISVNKNSPLIKKVSHGSVADEPAFLDCFKKGDIHSDEPLLP